MQRDRNTRSGVYSNVVGCLGKTWEVLCYTFTCFMLFSFFEQVVHNSMRKTMVTVLILKD